MIECQGAPGLVIAGDAGPVVGALIRLAVARGWRVACVGRHSDPELERAGAECIQVDSTESEAIESALSRLTSSWRQPPAALVYAGGIEAPLAAVTESVTRWDRVQDRQLGAAFVFAQAGAREMLRLRGGAPVDDGSIVFLGEASAARGIPGYPRASSGAAVTGMTGMMRQLAVEWGPYGIRVNMLQAGLIAGGGLQPEELSRRIPLGREGSPEEVAEACYYLISRASSYVTGVALAVDGGFLAT
ncbi:SDR family oxidoreductase [Leucobacter rhizosphaerae]|uniref:SDR family oxidoreductase n=1 Tax=Leucobacter rhizosphaerae TaxID=2932245 RepID=A0ABY4FVC5_9MICO|nr:SDR family oxidoreductase [Leucobacter rhizosphaerae]UOQ60181.1 SDR family oxidoreductase [Leucobacter rhizosphaerae]